MPLSDSMFLFDITVNDLKSYKSITDFVVTANFADVFQIEIKKPITNSAFKNAKLKMLREVSKVRKINTNGKNRSSNIQNGQSIMIVEKLSCILFNLKTKPLEISVFSKTTLDKLGTTIIPWSKLYSNYLRNVNRNPEIPPAYAQGVYNVYDDDLKRIAIIDVGVKLTYINKNIKDHFKSILQNNSINTECTQENSKQMIVSHNESTFNNIINVAHSTEHDLKSKNDFQLAEIKTRKKYINSNNFLQEKHFKKLNIVGLDFNTKSDTHLFHIKRKNISKTISCSSINYYKQSNILRYIFEDPLGSYGNQVYCVGYFTVEKNASDPESAEFDKSHKSNESEAKREILNGSRSSFLRALPEGARVDITRCEQIDCNEREHNVLSSPPDERILLDITNIQKACCQNKKIPEKIEQVFGGITTKMQVGEDPCFCTCECTFGFTRKTTYCDICGGYEIVGDDLTRKAAHEMPIPCPFYHKLVDKNKLKTWSSGSESKKRGEDGKIMKAVSPQRAMTSEKRSTAEKKSVESEKDSKKGKKRKKDDSFKFNYGYKAPQIGHSKCALPCTGTIGNVPKNMGWLWTAENVPGLRFRPLWKPGATSKHVVRLLKIARNPGEMISKKKRKDTGKKKRPLKRPLLVVHKKDGEFTVTMETMKNYSKPRAINQHPYEDKPVVTYTIGRTEEENRERLKKKERERRRLERAQRHFIQSTFRDMCHEICLKTYQQALGILPDTEDPACMCYPALPGPDTTNMNVSCSCSEDNSSLGSDTDSDEWIVEFTPPNATFDPTYKGKKVLKVDNGTQYTYLDYKVRLLDRFGNPVPRFFKGPDGKQQCSDLGGFWSSEGKWLEINVDGYIAPDNRWAPNIFIGPNGEHVDAEAGKFQISNGNWLIVGVDGYIDSQNKWKYYAKHTSPVNKKRVTGREVRSGKVIDKKYEKSETSWSCFGDVSPKQLSKLGIMGHGGDRKLLISALEDMLAHGEDVKIPQPKKVFHPPVPRKTKLDHMETEYDIRTKCRHPIPSDKGIVAVDAYGNKTYFRLNKAKNKRPKERLATLADQGISLSSFHVPCFNSFINSEIMKQQNRERLIALAGRTISTQIS